MSPAIRTRSRAVVALLALGGAAFGVSAPVWLRTTVSTALEPQVAVEVAGTTAAPAVSAAAFVTLACALATTLAGTVARRLALGVALLGGVAVAGGAVAVLADPQGPAVGAAADAAGVTTLTSPVTVTVWPWLAVAVGVAVVLVSLAGFLGAASWQASGGRHERAGTAPGPAVADEPDAQSDWDALSGGADPSADR